MWKRFTHRLLDWHHWPFALFHLPVIPVWLFYYVRSGSLWFMSPSNPTLSLGGFEGEAKTEMYESLQEGLGPATLVVQPGIPFSEVRTMVQGSIIEYPFIVKPDVGAKGIMFRKIESEQQLRVYHAAMPARYLLQEYLQQAYEVSVFYVRKPSEAKGEITAIIKKQLAKIAGDGVRTIEQLMEDDDHFANDLRTLKQQHKDKLNSVLAPGETLVLSDIANLYNGAHFINATQYKTSAMLHVFDEISHRCQFYYGRYDIRCNSLKNLEDGSFKILEFNGAGSVANHIFTGTFTMLQAYGEILRHWKALYQVSKHNHKNGHTIWSFAKGARFFVQVKKHFNKLKKIDRELVLPVSARQLQPLDIENEYGRIE